MDTTNSAMTSNSSKKYFPDYRLGVYCCGHIFHRSRAINYVCREGTDWQFLCGLTDHTDPREPYHVSIGVLIDYDPKINDLADLQPDEEAERQPEGLEWKRQKLGYSDIS